MVSELKGSRTERNLQRAFTQESQANRRYLYFAKVADVEGYPDIANLFRDTAEADTSHAHGHLDFMRTAGDPVTGEPFGTTEKNLLAAVASEEACHQQMYPEMAQIAREEGFSEIADWFDMLAKADASNAVRFRKAIESLK